MGVSKDEEAAVTGLNLHQQVSRKQQELGALEADQDFRALEKSGTNMVEEYELFGKSVVETKHLRWQDVEYKHTSSSDEESDNMEQDGFGMRADSAPESEFGYATVGSKMLQQGEIFGPQGGQENNDDLREKAEFLEAALKGKVMEIVSLKRASREKETDLFDKIECLELANEQLLQGGPDAGTDQLQMELIRLQNQNSILAQREHELQLQLSTTDMFRNELKQLQELNEQLINERVAQNVRAIDPEPEEPAEKLEERITFLETELAEAMEVNNMYKSQLQFSFSKEENVQATALRSYGNVTDIITELLDLRKRTKTQETELQDLRSRFILMSIHLAETEASREELLMKIKKLQNLQLKH